MTNPTPSERIVADTLTNVYSGGTELATAARNLRAHAGYCRAASDERTAVVADGVAAELEAGNLPALNFAGRTISPHEDGLPEPAPAPKPARKSRKRSSK